MTAHSSRSTSDVIGPYGHQLLEDGTIVADE